MRPFSTTFILTAITTGTILFANPTRAAQTGLVAVPGPNSKPTSTCDQTCYYVKASNGSDSADGRTPATAWRTLRKAAQTVGPGSTVLVASGVYSPLRITSSGTPDSWIKFVAAPGAHPGYSVERFPNRHRYRHGRVHLDRRLRSNRAKPNHHGRGRSNE